MKTLYRYEIEYQSYDGDTEVRLIELPVFRETEFTYFVGHQYQTSEMFGRKLRRVLKNAMNTYAYDTKEKALENFKIRTSKRIKWYEFWKEECEKALKIAEGLNHDQD